MVPLSTSPPRSRSALALLATHPTVVAVPPPPPPLPSPPPTYIGLLHGVRVRLTLPPSPAPWSPVGVALPVDVAAAVTAAVPDLGARLAAVRGDPAAAVGVVAAALVAAGVAIPGMTGVASPATTTAATATPRAAEHYTAVAGDLDTLHSFHGIRVVSLDADVCRLGVAITDPSGRVHDLALTIPPTYPTGPGAVTVHADVPAAFAPPPVNLPLPVRRRGEALAAAVTAAAAAFSTPRAQLFWSVMDDLDAACHVLEPPRGASRRRSVPYRRLALDAATATADAFTDVVMNADADDDVAATASSRHLSVRVWVAPSDAGGLPALALLGAAPVVQRLRAAADARAGSWKGARGGSIRAALAEVLGLGGASALPPPPPDPAAGRMTCGLCDTTTTTSGGNGNDNDTTAADDGRVPTLDSGGGLCGYVVCDTPSCARLYHRRCAVERFRLEGGSATYGIRSTLRGACPHCREELRVAVPPGE